MIKYFDLETYQKLKRLEKINQISSEDKQKLIDYRIHISDQIKYSSKADYVSLLDEYLEQNIPGYEFRLKFLELEKQNSKKTQIILEDSKKLGNLILSDKSKKFGDSMCEIAMTCIEFDVSWSESRSDQMSEADFYFLTKSYSSELIKEQLIYQSFKFLRFISGFAVLLLSNIFEIKI